MTSAQFISTLLQSRDAMHLAHWQSGKYGEHKTLDSYYSGILDLTDSFVEKLFGQKGRIAIEIPATKVEMPVAHLKRLHKTITEERINYSSDLQNIMDEMLGLINETLYLLTLA